MAQLNFAGEYKVTDLKLMTSSGNVVELGATYLAIDLYEDIFSSSMSGTVTFIDTNNICMNMPVTGQDFLSMRIETPSLEEHAIDYTDTVFVVTKIDARIKGKNVETVVLHFVSPELSRNTRVRVSKSYTDSIDRIVYDLLNNSRYINSNKELFIEPTKGIRKIVTPYVHPFTVIKNFTREALSKKYNSPHYLFYENRAGIHFRSLESLYRQATTGFYHSGDIGTIEDGNKKIEQEYYTVMDYQIKTNNDTLANITGGMLASRMYTYDMFQKYYELNTFNYFEEFNRYKRINFNNKRKDNPIYNEVILDEFGNNLSDFDDAVVHLYPTSRTEAGGDATRNDDNAKFDYNKRAKTYSPSGISDAYLKRQAKFMELNSCASASLRVKGNTTIMVGDIIDFQVPITGTNHSKDDSDIYYSGRYMISQLRHMFDKGTKQHEIVMNIVKDSFTKELPKMKESVQPKGDKGMLHTQFY